MIDHDLLCKLDLAIPYPDGWLYCLEPTAYQIQALFAETLAYAEYYNIISEKFYLYTVPIYVCNMNGERLYVSSQSVGPIVIDFDPNKLHQVIDGKHRILDAQRQGKDTILAWVGDKSLNEIIKASTG